MLSQAVRSACGILEGEPLEVRRDKVRARVAERIGEADRKRVTEFLGELIGTPFSDEDSLPLRAARIDALLMTEQMRTAFLEFLSAECANGSVLILLEDLHWGDRPTIQFLDHALRELRDKPLFVLALSRPEVREAFPELWAQRKLLEIHLKELGRKPVERLVRHALGEDVPLGTLERFVRLSEGNAFYLEELIRFAAEGRGGELPETVVAMVQSRLGTLDETSRRVLRAASVFGEVSWTGGVALLLGDGERKMTVREGLMRLVDREIFVKRKECRFLDEDEFAFRHALLREGAYGMLTEEDRVLGHKLAGEWLEARGEEDALLLADHFDKGGDKDRAAQHYQRAATRAYLAGDSKTAISHAQRGLACVVSRDQRAALLGMLCEAHFWQMELFGAAVLHADELLEIATKGSKPWIQGMSIKLNGALMTGKIADFDSTLAAIVAIDPSGEEAANGQIFALATGAIGLDYMGRVKEANVVMDRLYFVARSIEERVPGVRFLPPHGMPGMRDCYTHEDPASGLWHCETAQTLADARGDHRFRDMMGILFASMNRWFLGDTQEAERILLSSELPDEAFGYVSSLRPFILTWIHAERGMFEKAREHALRLVNAGKTRKLLLDEGRGHWALGEVLRRMGDWEAANAELEAAKGTLQMVCALDIPGVLASLAALRLAQGRLDEALVVAEDALDRYAKTGACSQFFRGAFLRLTHIEILEALGRHDDACNAIQKARQCILVNADKIGDSKLRASFIGNVPENAKTLELARLWCGESGE